MMNAPSIISPKFEVLASHKWTTFCARGPIHPDEIVATIHAHFDRMVTADVIWDFSGAVFPEVTAGDLAAIMEAAKVHAPKRRDARTVFVCKAPQMLSAISRYVALAAKEALTVDYGVHESLDEAERWLTCNRKHRCGSGDCEPGYASCPRGNCRSIRMFQAYRRYWGKTPAPVP